MSPPLDIDIRVGNHGDVVCEVSGVWLGLVQRVVKLEALHQGRREDEEAVRGEAHPHADPPPQAEGDEALVPDQPQLPGLRLLQEPLRSEHLCLGPHVGVLHEAPEVGHGVAVLGDHAVLYLNLFGHSSM